MCLIDAIESGPLTLADLASRTGLPRATTHRLAVALENHGLLGRDELGRFVLGRRLVSLGRKASTFSRTLVDAAGPALTVLRDETGESSQLFVRSGDRRICVVSLESVHSLRTIVHVGDALPMDRGSAGRALSSVGLTEAGWVQSVEERETGVASVSAPVLVDGEVVAAVSVSGPLGRTSRQPGKKYGTAVVAAARAVQKALG